jgi:WD40 repeat protein
VGTRLTAAWIFHWLKNAQTLRPGYSDSVNGVALNGDGRRAVSASDDHTLKVWDVDSGREVRTLEGHSDSVNGVALSGDGRRAVSASRDHTLKVWDVDSGKVLTSFNCDAAARCASFSDPSMIVAGDGLGRMHFLFLVLSPVLPE